MDPENTEVAPPRWMGMDYLTEPKLTRWAMASDLSDTALQALRDYRPEMAVVKAGARDTPEGKHLRWSLTDPTDSPEVEIVPFLIDWSRSEQHPAEALPERGCALTELTVWHPEAERMTAVLHRLGLSLSVRWAHEAKLQAVLQTPEGEVSI